MFIVRVWREGREIKDAAPEWRGSIEHVPSGKRRYLKELRDVITFIAVYLEKMGVRLERQWRVKQWLNRWNLSLKVRR